MSSRFLSATLTAALLLNTSAVFAARPVSAGLGEATSDEIIAKIQAYDANALCANRTGTELGKCVTDKIKALKRMQDELHDALELERTAWETAHASLGSTPEYQAALRIYLNEVKVKRKAFNDAKLAIEKSFHNERKVVRTRGASSSQSSRFSRPVTSADIEAATQKCRKQKDTTALRICMRQQLRLIDPNARQYGAGTR